MNADRSNPHQKGRASPGTSTERPPRRGGFSHSTSTLLAVAAGIATWIVGTIVGRLVFENTYGPLGSFSPVDGLPVVAGKLAGYGCGAALGLAAFASSRWLGRRSRVALLLCFALAAPAGWALYPERMVVSQFNARAACTGLTFIHNPPRSADMGPDRYCVGRQTTTTSPASGQECQDVRLHPGPVAAEVALGYASTEYGFDESGQLRLCLKGFGHQTVTVAAPGGVEVTPAQTSSGPSTNVVLRFAIRVQPMAHGALSIEIRDKGHHLSVYPAFGPTITSSASGWRIVQ